MAIKKLTCTKCGKAKATEKHFYMSHSTMYTNNEGRIPVCKDCTLDKYNDLVEKYMDELKALYHLCMNLDVYYGNDLATSVYAKMKKDGKDNLVKLYFSKVNSLMQYKGMSSIDSDSIILDDSILKDCVTETKVSESGEVEVGSEILKRWGRGYTNEEYHELEERYDEWLQHYDHETLAKEKLFRELSEFELLKNRARAKNDNKTYRDLSELISKKMGDADIKPTQKKAMADGEGDTFGTIIEDVEKTVPILAPSKEFEDVDKIYYYIKSYFIKPFARVMGLAEANDQGDVELNQDFATTLEEGDSDDEDQD